MADTTYQIAVDEVAYFESRDRDTLVHTDAGAHVIRTPLAELLQRLDAQQFWQVHRGTVINVARVVSSQRDEFGRV